MFLIIRKIYLLLYRTHVKISNDMQGLDKKFVGIEKIYKEVSMK